MFQDKLGILRTALRLAEELEDARQSAGFNALDSAKLKEYMHSQKGQLVSEKRAALTQYLESLDYDDVKMVQTVMYLGRDAEYDDTDPPEVRYQKVRGDLDLVGWVSKEVEADQMVQKSPFADYLRAGCSALGIDL